MNPIPFVAEGKGPDVLFLHGFCETSDIWTDWKKNLTGARLILVDLPGFGNSPPLSGTVTIDRVAEKIADLIVYQQFKPVLVGHSLGGYVALAVAEKIPALTEGLVLFHSTPYADTEDRKALRDKTIGFVRENGVDAFSRLLIPNLFHQKDLPSVAQMQQLAAQTPQQTVLDYTAAMRDRPDRVAAFLAFNGKKAIIAGEHDALIPVDAMRTLAQQNRDIQLCILENTAHMGMFENPSASARFIGRVLQPAVRR